MRESRLMLPGVLAAAGLFLIATVPRAADPPTTDPPKSDPPKALTSRAAAEVAADIDRDIDKKLQDEKVPASPVADDAEFMRRAYLDITGHLPTPAQAVTFLDSKDENKRAKLIDELLESPNYGKHFGIIWSDLITGRDDNNRTLRTDDFRAWLAEQFNKGRPWGETVTDMVTASGDITKVPQATFVAANRCMNNFAPDKMVDTTTLLFMGVQLQCAQCHKHPFIAGWKQEDFWGIAAFFSQTRTAGAGMQNRGAAITVSDGGAAPGRPGAVRGPAKPGGAVIEIPDPTDPRKRTGRMVKAKFFQGEEPQLEEKDKDKFRATFAGWLTAPENKFFANATVNRLWAHFFARGIVNPIDDFQDANPPTHPAVLALLAKEFNASGQDLKHVVRIICNTKAYQRTSRPLSGNTEDDKLYSHLRVKVMSPEVLYDALTQALEVQELRQAVRGFGPPGGGGRGAPGGGSRGEFVRFFTTKEAGDDPDEFSLGVPQFLRLMNSAQFNGRAPVVERLMKDDTPADKVIEGLYLATLSRRPTETEAKKLGDYAAKKSKPGEGYDAVLWVLLNSAEFVCVR
jgi:hypothetical protein